MKYALIVIIVHLSSLGFTQTRCAVQLTLNQRKLGLDSALMLNDSVSVTLSKCQFYLGVQHKKKTTYHLIDISNNNSFIINHLNSFISSFGIDSITQVSGVFGGDLDPTNGMYWAWHSGYIHLKMEGVFVVHQTTQAFEFHIGGYQSSYNTFQELNLPLKDVHILEIDLAPFLTHSIQLNDYKVMSPQKDAVKLSQLFIQSIKTL